MSMNLHCEQVDLWQTPTHISYMCMLHDDDHWEDIRDRYIWWVKSFKDGCFRTDEEYQKHLEECKVIDSHIKELMSYDELEFYIM